MIGLDLIGRAIASECAFQHSFAYERHVLDLLLEFGWEILTHKESCARWRDLPNMLNEIAHSTFAQHAHSFALHF